MALAMGPSVGLESRRDSLGLSQTLPLVDAKELMGALESTFLWDLQRRLVARKRWRLIKWLVYSGLLFPRRAPQTTPGSKLSWHVRRELNSAVPPLPLEAQAQALSALASVPRVPHGCCIQGVNTAWRDLCGDSLHVRGRNYLNDRIKVPAEKPLLTAVGADWFTDSERMDHLCARPGCLPQTEAGKALPFIFAVNLQVPGPPHYSWIVYFAADRPIRDHPGSLLHQFCTAPDDEFRNRRLKLIPRIADGSWVVKRAVGTKPCILGKALQCTYHRGRNYLEMDCDIGSSVVARNVVSLVVSYLATLVIDYSYVIEAQETEELPEYVLGSLSGIRLDPKAAVLVPPPSRPAQS